MMSAFADYTTFTFETDPTCNFETNDKVQIDGNGRHNTITVTRNIHGGLNSIFSGNTFGGTFNVVKQSIKNLQLLQKSIVG